jgi:hypothetical protein
MTRSLIAFVVCVTLAATATLGCSSDPSPGEPGAACLPRDGETTPLFCVCGYPCVDGICVADPDISCGEALEVPEPDIVVEDDADEKIAGDAETDATDALDAEDDEVTTEPPSNDDVE